MNSSIFIKGHQAILTTTIAELKYLAPMVYINSARSGQALIFDANLYPVLK